MSISVVELTGNQRSRYEFLLRQIRVEIKVLKALGYLVSTLSVLLLGVVAWPTGDEPSWKAVVTIAGMAASIIGMGLRYLSYRGEQAKLEDMRSRSHVNRGFR